jgi:hypothetical protein
MKFTYGFTTKTIRGKEYTYFWKYTGTGHKTEVYVDWCLKSILSDSQLNLHEEKHWYAKAIGTYPFQNSYS